MGLYRRGAAPRRRSVQSEEGRQPLPTGSSQSEEDSKALALREFLV